jgi:hypothetical protein
MVLRALIVLLVVVNIGVAAWWATRAPPRAPASPATPAGVPRLQLLAEVPRARLPQARPAPVAENALPVRCFRFGPYTNPALLRRAHARLQAQAIPARVREVPAGEPRGWRVFMPPLASQAEAEARVARMRAAGIDDLLVLRDGDDANAIALGQYSSEASARRRQQALAAAGHVAQVAPIGDVAVQGWIDAGGGDAFAAQRIAQDIAAATHAAIDCATLDAAG